MHNAQHASVIWMVGLYAFVHGLFKGIVIVSGRFRFTLSFYIF